MIYVHLCMRSCFIPKAHMHPKEANHRKGNAMWGKKYSIYRYTCILGRTESQNLNVQRLVLHFSQADPLKVTHCNERSPTKMMNPIKQWFWHFIQLITIKSESGTKERKKKITIKIKVENKI